MKKFFTIMVAALAVMALAVPVMAAEPAGPGVTVGGRFWTDFGYQTVDKDLVKASPKFNEKVNADDYTTAFLNLNANSYLRLTFESEMKDTGGMGELRIGSNTGDAESVGFSYMYGWWKFGNCKLVAGQTDSWLGSLAYAPRQYLATTNDAKILLIDQGFLYSGRHPQIRYEMWLSKMFGFSVGLVAPNAEVNSIYADDGAKIALGNSDQYFSFPAAEIAVWLRFGGFETTPAFGIQQGRFQTDNQSPVKLDDDDYIAWVATLPLKFTAGMFTFKGGVYFGINNDTVWGGEINGNGDLGVQPMVIPVAYTKDNGRVGFEDTQSFGGWAAFEFQVGDLTPTIGGGYVQTENDLWDGMANDMYQRYSLFVALPWQVTKNFDIQPEFGYYDYGDNLHNVTLGNEWLLGIAMRFIF